MLKSFHLYNDSLDALPDKQLLITTLNAHSYNVAIKDAAFTEALQGSDVLLADGISVVWAARLLRRVNSQQSTVNSQELRKTLKKIAGEDLFYWEMNRLETTPNPQTSPQPSPLGEGARGAKNTAFFLGSTEEVLAKIKERAGVEFPNVEVHTYSPPYKPEFTEEDNRAMYAAIHAVQPDVLFVGMTAPKQEKWAMQYVVGSRQSVVGSEEKKKEEVSSRQSAVGSEEKKEEEVSSRQSAVGSEEKREEVVSSRQSAVGSEEKKEEEVSSRQSSVSSQQSSVSSEKVETIDYQLPTTNYQLPTNCHVCCIGAVFDFYAGTVQRAPRWMIKIHLEWFYRLIKEPRRMWKRYLIGNVKFVWAIAKELVVSSR